MMTQNPIVCNFDRQSIPHGAEKRKSGFLLCKTDFAAEQRGKYKKECELNKERNDGGRAPNSSAVLARLHRFQRLNRNSGTGACAGGQNRKRQQCFEIERFE